MLVCPLGLTLVLPNFLPQLANFLNGYIHHIRDILHLCISRSLVAFFYQNLWSFEFQSLKLIFLCLISVSHPPRPLRFWLFLKRNATHGLVVWIYVCLLALRFLSFKGKMCCLPEKEECKNWRRNEVQPWFIIYHIISYHIISGRMLNSEEDRCA